MHSTAWRPQNILNKKGLKTLVKEVMELKEGGCVWRAPECTTWIFVARSGTSRTIEKPQGNSRVARVGSANRMMVALTAVLCLAWLRSVHMCVERPTSLLNHFQPYAMFASFVLKHT